MALLKCPECGKEVSDQAKSCPNCGYPLKKSKFPAWIVLCIIGILVVVIITAVTFSNKPDNGNTANNASSESTASDNITPNSNVNPTITIVTNTSLNNYSIDTKIYSDFYDNPLLHVTSDAPVTVDVIYKYMYSLGNGNKDDVGVQLTPGKYITKTIDRNHEYYDENHPEQYIYISIRDHSTGDELSHTILVFRGESATGDVNNDILSYSYDQFTNAMNSNKSTGKNNASTSDLSSDSKTSASSGGLELEDTSFYTHNGYKYATGRVANNSKDKSYKYVKVKVTYYNKDGEFVSTDWTYAVDSMPLAPGENKYFEFKDKIPTVTVNQTCRFEIVDYMVD